MLAPGIFTLWEQKRGRYLYTVPVSHFVSSPLGFCLSISAPGPGEDNSGLRENFILVHIDLAYSWTFPYDSNYINVSQLFPYFDILNNAA